MRRAIAWLGLAAFAFCALVALTYWLHRGDLVEAGLAGITLAISLTPEEFPMVLVIFLALGSWRLAQRNVLVRRSAAIETLGAVSMLCVDKTGTLTRNHMELAALARDREVWRRDNGQAPTGNLRWLLDVAVYASAVQPSYPMDRALYEFEAEDRRRPDVALSIQTFPLRPDRLAFIHLWREADGVLAAAKGAPEAIFKLCAMKAQESAEPLRAVESLAEDGLRVLAVASARAASSGNFDRIRSAFISKVWSLFVTLYAQT
jgi:Ca2+-transporting ATPase